jgi:signal transduction histidine kinase
LTGVETLVRRFSTIRVRTTAVALTVVAVSLVVGAIGLVSLLRVRLVGNIDTALELRAADLVGLVEGSSPLQAVASTGDGEGFVQVIAPDGTVVAATANIEGEAPLANDAELGRPRTMRVAALDGRSFRVLVMATPSDPPSRVVVASSTDDVGSTTRAVAAALGLGLPVLVGIVTGTTWILVGRTLRPVDAIRAEVTDIKGGGDLHRRVPEPPTDDEVGRLARTMNEMLDRLEDAQAKQRRFVSDASHELRTPIASIRHQLEVGLARPDATEWSELAGGLLAEDLRMGRLVDNLLWLARNDESAPRVGRALVDLDDIVLTEAERARAEGAHIDVHLVSAGQVRGEPDDVLRAVRNLVDNAVRYATHTVALGVHSAGGSVTLSVDDDGPGVPERQRAHIFERFTRAQEARGRDEGGAGLGLAITAEIAKKHDAAITVTTSPTLGGARFLVLFPDARAEHPGARLGS